MAWGEVEADDEPSAHGSHLAPASRDKPGWFSSVTTWAWDTGQWTWEVGSAGSLGLAQGGANTINVVHDALIGTGNLIGKGVNTVEGTAAPAAAPRSASHSP